jgi:aspartate/methionine/tyrosine aminotransferase
VAALGEVNLGHFLPDYTAYEELLDIFKLFTSIPILLDGRSGYQFGLDQLRREITGRGLSAILLSNPCNPTGRVIQGRELEEWVGVARELGCTLLVDEFYSHYILTARPGALPVESAARYVENVDRDPVVILDGLTKNWRYPGWRVTWTVGPKQVIDAFKDVASAREDNVRFINEAEGYRSVIIPEVRGRVEMILREAEAYREEKIRRAQGEAQRFLQILGEYQRAREITRKRLLLETLEEVLPQMDKIILEDGAGANLLPLLPLGKPEPQPRLDGTNEKR